VTKKLIIETCSTEGKCYLRLLPLLKEFDDWSAKELEHAVIYLSTSLGEYPQTRDLLIIFRHVSVVGLGNLHSEYEIPMDKELARFLLELDTGRFRFGFEEKENSLHVTYYMRDELEQTDSFVEQGWHPLIILNKLTNMSLRVGGDATTEAFFDDLFAEEKSRNHQEARNHRNPEPVRKPRMQVIREYDDAESNMDDLHRKIEQMNEEAIATELEPNDSSSQADRYLGSRKYMIAGSTFAPERSLLTVGRRTGQALSEMNSSLTILPEKNPVVGYQKTTEMASIEKQVHAQAYEINGLAGPFKDNRLNLLLNIDNAMSTYGFRYSDIMRTLTEVRDLKPQNPSEQLLSQIVINTFDLDNRIVIANVYKFPFVEVGMPIDEQMLERSFKMIELEFKQRWFNSMKMLNVPDFHNEYRRSRTKSHAVTKTNIKEKPPGTKQFIRRASSGGSILSVLTS